MKIRKAKLEELDTILEIYDGGRRFMRAHGNMFQWAGGYPSRSLLEDDINSGHLFVVTDDEDKDILSVFAYILGKDPTYAIIDNGSWLNDDDYGTIHRIASSGKQGGTAHFVYDWALGICENLRIDTHADNYVMQSVCENYGFKMCGIIYLEDGAPRIAYQITRKMRETHDFT